MAICGSCHEDLVMWIDESEEEDGEKGRRRQVDDDVQLTCGCHFHWECLFEAYSATECPCCARDLITFNGPHQQVLCTVKNEGGLQEGIDILPQLSEELHLRSFPDQQRCLAFLTLCETGDVEAMIDLLAHKSEGGTEEVSGYEGCRVLLYQDQVRDMSSGLHIAIRESQPAVIWLLLWLASDVPTEKFPADVITTADQFSLRRGLLGQDIRTLRNDSGQTAEALAASLGASWDRAILRAP